MDEVRRRPAGRRRGEGRCDQPDLRSARRHLPAPAVAADRRLHDQDAAGPGRPVRLVRQCRTTIHRPGPAGGQQRHLLLPPGLRRDHCCPQARRQSLPVRRDRRVAAGAQLSPGRQDRRRFLVHRHPAVRLRVCLIGVPGPAGRRCPVIPRARTEEGRHQKPAAGGDPHGGPAGAGAADRAGLRPVRRAGRPMDRQPARLARRHLPRPGLRRTGWFVHVPGHARVALGDRADHAQQHRRQRTRPAGRRHGRVQLRGVGAGDRRGDQGPPRPGTARVGRRRRGRRFARRHLRAAAVRRDSAVQAGHSDRPDGCRRRRRDHRPVQRSVDDIRLLQHLQHSADATGDRLRHRDRGGLRCGHGRGARLRLPVQARSAGGRRRHRDNRRDGLDRTGRVCWFLRERLGAGRSERHRPRNPTVHRYQPGGRHGRRPEGCAGPGVRRRFGRSRCWRDPVVRDRHRPRGRHRHRRAGQRARCGDPHRRRRGTAHPHRHRHGQPGRPRLPTPGADGPGGHRRAGPRRVRPGRDHRCRLFTGHPGARDQPDGVRVRHPRRQRIGRSGRRAADRGTKDGG